LNNEFWTSMWASDTIIRYTNTGSLIAKYTIAGLTGTRSITTDGTFLYMGTSSNTIYVVNPATQTLLTTITSAAPVTSRFLTFDPTLNSGSGGFWTGNFNTDIVAISLTGAVLATIPAATHTLTGMYGAAVDNVNSGGPYLWVFHQAGASNSQITVLNLTTGVPTVFTHDVFPDISATYSLVSGLAGGAFFTTSYTSGPTIFGMVQGSPVNVIVGYDATLAASVDDIAAVALSPVKGYTMIPSSQIFSETFVAGYQNLGTSSVAEINGEFNFYYNSTLVATENYQATNVPSAGTGIFTSNPFAMSNGVGTYDVTFTVTPDVGTIDGNPANDQIIFTFEVTDSIYARDNGVSTGNGYTVSATDSAYAVSLFTVNASDMVTGIWIQLETPADGDSTFALIFNYDGVAVTNEVARGFLTLISAAQNTYYLAIPNGVVLSPATYAFGVYEGVGVGIGLSQSTSIFTAGTNFFNVGGAWTASGIQTARFIRPVFGNTPILGLDENEMNEVNVYPVPANDVITVEFAKELSEAGTLTIVDLNGRIVLAQNFAQGTTALSVALKTVQAGTYLLNVTTPSTNMVRTIVVQ